jgi:hypothetical protein
LEDVFVQCNKEWKKIAERCDKNVRILTTSISITTLSIPYKV